MTRRQVWWSGNLLAGLVLLVVVVAAPTFAVLVSFRRDLRAEGEAQARMAAAQQVELIDNALTNLVNATQEVMIALGEMGAVRRMDPACGASLDRVRAHLADYALFAVMRPNGDAACVSAARPLTGVALQPVMASFAAADRFTVGHSVTVASIGSSVLTFAEPLYDDNGARIGVVIAGLDLRRLDAVLAGTQVHPGATIVIRDREATVLAHVPASAGRTGEPEAGLDRAMMARRGQDAMVVRGQDGQRRVIGFSPVSAEPAALFVSAAFSVPDVTQGIAQAAWRGYRLIGLGMACSFLFALLFGYRYLRAPAAVLLAAARRLGGGDLSARAVMPAGAAPEFAGLGRAFNEMAELLQRQRTELQGLNEALEVRVGQRTRALLESNNRLQVEIAERELTEANLRQAQKLQAVGQLAGGVAHDFNNLLTVILGSLELLRKYLSADAARSVRLIDNATSAVERGSRLTSQLLAFARKQPLLSVSLDVSEVIGAMRDLLASTLDTTVRLHITLEDGLWPVLLDPNQFEAAILNIAINGRTAMPNGGRMSVAAANVVLTQATALAELPPGDYVRVAIADSGCGMSPEVMSRAFEPFFTTKEQERGAGLGLSQVHGMVRQSGGSVTIESRPGDGTTVTMLLPRCLTAPVPQGSVGGEPSLPALARDRLVLLVDDDIQVREVTAAMLTENGYTVVPAGDGGAGLAALEREGQRVALVIADYAMPGMTGRELLEIVRSRRPDVAVLLATGYADYPDLTSEALAIDQIVRKPFRARELLARIHMVCERQARAQAESGPG